MLVGCPMPAMAGIQLAADHLSVPGIDLAGLSVWAENEPGGGLRVRLQSQQVDIPALGWRKLGLACEGSFQRDAAGRLILDTSLKLARAPGGALGDARVRVQWDEAANTLQATIAQGAARGALAMPLDQPTHLQIDLDSLPAAWLKGSLAATAVQPKAGSINASLAVDLRDDGLQAAGQFDMAAIDFDAPGGRLAADKLSATSRISVDTTGRSTRLGLDGSLRGGKLLLGDLYVELPGHPVMLTADIEQAAGGTQLHRLHLVDPDALTLDGSASFGPGKAVGLQLDDIQAHFPAAYDRYGKGLSAWLGFPAISIAGSMQGALSLAPSGLRSFRFDTQHMDVALAGGQLGVKGLRGGLDWAAGQTRPATTLGWSSLDVWRIPNGAAVGHWQTERGVLGLTRPLQVPVLDGTLSVREASWQPGKPSTVSLVLTQVDMAALSRALGWPEFHGTLAGAVPSLRYDGDRLELAGGLSINVFDGFVDVTRLALQQPFGSTPVLTADVALRQLDLALVTGVFDFGNITGRMDGTVGGLRMVGWQPAAFTARLQADGGGKISQRAVNNLTSVGGGVVAGGLQGKVMKLFQNFSYRRLALGCELRGDVCRMTGLADGRPPAEGYTIVEGSGLPHLTIVGHQSQVDWPTLVRRLQAAIHGGGPVID